MTIADLLANRLHRVPEPFMVHHAPLLGNALVETAASLRRRSSGAIRKVPSSPA
jgi:hypothetical protein